VGSAQPDPPIAALCVQELPRDRIGTWQIPKLKAYASEKSYLLYEPGSKAWRTKAAEIKHCVACWRFTFVEV